ncbi:MAG: hypothetical protein LBR11_09745 [Deltaproteobacteria bacterium]|nr:hypothetical protein [Deltaproteobacteria bacterium]
MPLLTVMGIKDGIIGTLTKRLIENPRNLELTPRGTGSFSESFFEDLRAHPQTGFVIPETRTLSASISLIKPGYPNLLVDLKATGPGDPVVGAGLRPLDLTSSSLDPTSSELKPASPAPEPALSEPDLAAPAPSLALTEPDLASPAPEPVLSAPEPAVSESNLTSTAPELVSLAPNQTSPEIKPALTASDPAVSVSNLTSTAPELASPAPNQASPEIKPALTASDPALSEPDLAAPAPGLTSTEPDLASPAPDSASPELKSALPALNREVYLSQATAHRLNVQVGDSLVGQIGRFTSGFLETVQVELRVMGVLPEEVVKGYFLFCSLPLLKTLEDYRSGFAVPELGWPGREKPQAETLYPLFRLYARDLDSVDALKAHLDQKGVEMNSRAEEIALVRRLDHSFTVVFLALLAVVGGGAFASVASGAVDQVAKIRRSLAVLALLGLSRAQLMAFTIFQSLLTGFLAVILAEGLFLGLSQVLNLYFGGSFGLGERVCFLAPQKLALAGGAVLVFMLAASTLALVSLLDLEPSEGMRDV